MKKQSEHFFQNYKELFVVGMMASPAFLGVMFMVSYARRSANYMLSYDLYMTMVMIILTLIIVLSIYNYRYLIKNKKSARHPIKQTFLLIWEILCWYIGFFLYLFRSG